MFRSIGVLVPAALSALAQQEPATIATNSFLQHLAAAVVFSALGLLVFALAIWMCNKVLPFSFRKEIEEDQNQAVAIIVGAMMIGVSIIIAAAISG
jgi:uncharacterized membrane protein YjfL (UPF0719 family)